MPITSRVAGMAALLGLLFLAGCRPSFSLLVNVDRESSGAVAGRLDGPSPPLVLDIRAPERYREGHISGAWLASRADLEKGLVDFGVGLDHPIVVACNSGLTSIAAAAVIQGQGYRSVVSLEDGMQGWERDGHPVETGQERSLPRKADQARHIPVSLFGKLIAVASGFVIKPIYMILSLVLILVLRRASAVGLARIRLGLVLFLAGEIFCAANYLLVGGSSLVLDVMHNVGMVFLGMLVAWGLVEIIDERFLLMTPASERCALQRFCGPCFKRQPVTCLAQRIFLLGSGVLAVVSLIPVTGAVNPRAVYATIFGTEVFYSYSLGLTLIDFRLLPFLGALFFLVAMARLAAARDGDRLNATAATAGANGESGTADAAGEEGTADAAGGTAAAVAAARPPVAGQVGSATANG
ncbi:MAG: rhodanese-like domain-containing protein, partial [Pseudomonadota bacterium]